MWISSFFVKLFKLFQKRIHFYIYSICILLLYFYYVFLIYFSTFSDILIECNNRLLSSVSESLERKRNVINNCAVNNFSISSQEESFIQQYKCQFCDKTFSKAFSLQQHILVHTIQKNFECHVCKKTFLRRGQLKVHFRVHTGERPYKCQFCDYSATQSYDLVRHTRAKHTNNHNFVTTV